MMRLLTKRHVRRRVDEIIEVVLERTEYGVEVCGYHDYDVHLDISEEDRGKVADLVWRILAEKK